MDVYYFYSYGTAAWMGELADLRCDKNANGNVAMQAVPLVTSPTMIVALLSPEVRDATSTQPSNPSAQELTVQRSS